MTAQSNSINRGSAKGDLYTPEELMVRLKFFIGICLTLTLMGIIFTILYSVIFVTQPLKAIAPIDQKFFEVIIPVASFLCGILSGIMLNSSNAQALDAVQKTMANFKDTSAQAGKAPDGLGLSVSYQSQSVGAPAPKPVSSRTEPNLEATPVTTGYKGKLAPPPAPQPEIE